MEVWRFVPLIVKVMLTPSLSTKSAVTVNVASAASKLVALSDTTSGLLTVTSTLQFDEFTGLMLYLMSNVSPTNIIFSVTFAEICVGLTFLGEQEHPTMNMVATNPKNKTDRIFQFFTFFIYPPTLTFVV